MIFLLIYVGIEIPGTRSQTSSQTLCQHARWNCGIRLVIINTAYLLFVPPCIGQDFVRYLYFNLHDCE